MTAVIKILGLVSGESSPFDGEWLREYDPERDGTAPTGEPTLAHIVTTPTLPEAKRYPTQAEAMEDYRRVDGRNPHGGRKDPADGKLNRPLTAFNVEVMDERKAQAEAIESFVGERREADRGDVCDFCSSPEVRWEYPAKDFQLGGWGSKGEWAACDTCSTLIEAELWSQLANRAAATFTERYEREVGPDTASPTLHARDFTRLHRQFRKSRTGERRPYRHEGGRPAETTPATQITGNGRIFLLDGRNRLR